jgi:hypothetical protein
VADAGESQRGKCVLDGLALRVEDAFFGTDQDGGFDGQGVAPSEDRVRSERIERKGGVFSLFMQVLGMFRDFPQIAKNGPPIT